MQPAVGLSVSVLGLARGMHYEDGPLGAGMPSTKESHSERQNRRYRSPTRSWGRCASVLDTRAEWQDTMEHELTFVLKRLPSERLPADQPRP